MTTDCFGIYRSSTGFQPHEGHTLHMCERSYLNVSFTMCQWLIQYPFGGGDQRWANWSKYKSKFKCIKAVSTLRSHVNWSQMVEAFSVHRPFPISSVAYHNDCPLENVLRHLNMHTEHYKWQQKNLTESQRSRKKTERNEMQLYLFIFDFLVKCRLPFISFHSIPFDSYLWNYF